MVAKRVNLYSDREKMMPLFPAEHWSLTHADTGSTCKLRTERPRPGFVPQDVLAARRQFYPLHHTDMPLYFRNIKE